ncbi:MAG TPA: ATP-binding cassette domain-containing protein [Acholeplasmataceae bacterium]|nr:ATP-binding cassette domain-containing protein [Acholeplasmataceae bacterium]
MLELKNVTKVFNKDQNEIDRKVALDDLTITVEDGDFITVIGSNGSGKSTFLNVVTGMHFADIGHVVLDGLDITKMKQYKRAKYMGMVYQDPMQGTASNMSILENMEMALKRGKRKTLRWGFSAKNKDLFKNLLARLDLGLEQRMDQKIGLLSGGQRQAITLLMATLNSPKLLLLDEHTAALDPKTAKTVLDISEKIIQNEKLTTIMITHNMKDAIRYGNRLLMFNEGKVILDVRDEEKKNLTIEKLLQKFSSTNVTISDQLVLAK